AFALAHVAGGAAASANTPLQQGAPASAQALIADAHPATKQLLLSPQSQQAVAALDRILARGHVSASQLGQALKNPHVTPYVVEALTNLDKTDHVLGVDRVLHRLATAGNRGVAVGSAFELRVGAQLGARVKE